jgi:hypothetical protein
MKSAKKRETYKERQQRILDEIKAVDTWYGLVVFPDGYFDANGKPRKILSGAPMPKTVFWSKNLAEVVSLSQQPEYLCRATDIATTRCSQAPQAGEAIASGV